MMTTYFEKCLGDDQDSKVCQNTKKYHLNFRAKNCVSSTMQILLKMYFWRENSNIFIRQKKVYSL